MKSEATYASILEEALRACSETSNTLRRLVFEPYMPQSERLLLLTIDDQLTALAEQVESKILERAARAPKPSAE